MPPLTLRDTADAWNDNIERWIYATGGDLAQQIGVEGYYVRIAPPDSDGAASPTQGFVPIKNRPPGESTEQASHLVSPDSLGAGAIRVARARRSPHSEYGSCHRRSCCACNCRRVHAGIAITATATASTKMGRLSTEPGSAVPGLCWPGNALTMNWPRAIQVKLTLC